jgi:hypothetical protein
MHFGLLFLSGFEKMEKAVFCGETITLLFSRDEKSNYFAAEKR